MKELTTQHTNTVFHKHKWPFLSDSLNYLSTFWCVLGFVFASTWVKDVSLTNLKTLRWYILGSTRDFPTSTPAEGVVRGVEGSYFVLLLLLK